MKNSEEYRLSEYEDLGPLDGNNKIHLKRNRINGVICVEKHVPLEKYEIYTFLKNNPSCFIPYIYECICGEDFLIIIEEYIVGRTLEEILKERDIDEKEAVSIIIRLCDALRPLHCADPPIICRDLKAENIMMDHKGNIKIIDFNIARTFCSGKTRDTRILGTREYAAPEQYGYFQTDNRTDIYALGILLNYMILKKFPVEQIVGGKLEHVVRICTNIDPGQRYQSVEILAGELKYLYYPGFYSEKVYKDRTRNKKYNDQRNSEKKYLSNEKIKKNQEEGERKNWLPPGFRSKTPWKILVAIFGYIFLTWMCFTTTLTKEGVPMEGVVLRFEQFMIWISQIIFIDILFDYFKCRKKLPLIKNKKIWIRIFGYFILEIVLLTIAAMICVIVEGFFF